MLRKNRKLPIIASALATVALASVGFSTWIISAQAEAKSIDDVTMTVGEVNDQRLEINILESPAPDKSLTFDGTTDGTNTMVSGTAASEDLEFGFSFTVGAPNASASTTLAEIQALYTGVQFKLTITNNESAYNDAATANTIIAPLTIGSQKQVALNSTGTIEGDVFGTTSRKQYTIEAMNKTDVKKVEYTCTFRFSYGSFFGFVNPVKSTTTVDDTFIDNLELLSAANGTKFKLEVSTYKA